MKKKFSTCRDAYDQICDNLGQDLKHCREIKRHLAGCPNCVAYLDSLKKTITLYREYPSPKIPGRTRKELFARLKLN